MRVLQKTKLLAQPGIKSNWQPGTNSLIKPQHGNVSDGESTDLWNKLHIWMFSQQSSYLLLILLRHKGTRTIDEGTTGSEQPYSCLDKGMLQRGIGRQLLKVNQCQLLYSQFFSTILHNPLPYLALFTVQPALTHSIPPYNLIQSTTRYKINSSSIHFFVLYTSHASIAYRKQLPL